MSRERRSLESSKKRNLLPTADQIPFQQSWNWRGLPLPEPRYDLSSELDKAPLSCPVYCGKKSACPYTDIPRRCHKEDAHRGAHRNCPGGCHQLKSSPPLLLE